MDKPDAKIPSLVEQQIESIRYWQSKNPAERIAEGWRLSVEHFGMPVGDLRDGPVQKIHRLPDGTEVVVSEWSGSNALRHE